MISIAADNGFLWESVWHHPDNSQLKNKRKHPNALRPGDVLKIPDKQLKESSAATNQRHRFVKKGMQAKLRLKITRNNAPRANAPFTLNIDGNYTEGRTDGEGMIDVPIPSNAVQGVLKIGEGSHEEFFRLKLGTVDPIDTESGVRGRLRSLGYDDGPAFDELLKEFQRKEQLEASGRLDEATKNKLEELFGQ